MERREIGHLVRRLFALGLATAATAYIFTAFEIGRVERDARLETARMQGMPASPAYFAVDQPDGTRFRARLFGDERYHYMETANGYTVKRNPTSGYYEFLEVDRTGRFMFSGVRAGIESPSAAGIRKHIREKDAVRKKRIEAFTEKKLCDR